MANQLYRVRRISDNAVVSVRVSYGSIQLLWCSSVADQSAFVRARAQAVAMLMALAAGPRADEIFIEEVE